jgi:arylsulfatase
MVRRGSTVRVRQRALRKAGNSLFLARAPSVRPQTCPKICPQHHQLAYFVGESDESLRNEFFYHGEHELFALRYRNWKIHFQVKDDWFAGQLRRPTVPQPVNLRVDPFEQHMDSPYYPFYVGETLWTVIPGAYLLQQHAESFRELPPRQAPANFNPQEMLNSALNAAAAGLGNAT